MPALLRLTLRYTVAVAVVFVLPACVHAARDTTGFSVEDKITVAASFEQTWQAVKAALREQRLDLHTRDKNGYFVAYTSTKRQWLQPRRIKYTVQLTPVSKEQTLVRVEAVRQVYGSTLLTEPDWHERKLEDPSVVASLLQAIQAKITTAPGA